MFAGDLIVSRYGARFQPSTPTNRYLPLGRIMRAGRESSGSKGLGMDPRPTWFGVMGPLPARAETEEIAESD